MRFLGWLRTALAVTLFGMGLTAPATSQVSDTTHPQFATVIGRVVDSSGMGMSDAEVLILAGDQPVVRPIASDSQGHFQVRNLPAGRAYTFVARKIGYQPARGRDVYVNADDTLRLQLVLTPLAVVLSTIEVKGRRGHRSSLFADEFASKVKVYRDALSLMAWSRPYMLGDPEFCSPPDSFGRPTQDRIRLKITDRLILNTMGQNERLSALTSKPWLHSVRFDSFNDTIPLPYVRQVYVNGLRVDRPDDPIRTPLRMLRAIPSEYIAEMHYVDCWNTSVPFYMQYSIFVTLKALSPEQQAYLSRFVLNTAALPGPVDGRVLSIKRPSRELWDSLLQEWTGHNAAAYDSTPSPSP